MKTIFECIDNGTDGMDWSVIGYCSDKRLAHDLVLGRGAMGSGDGEIKPIILWESASDLPPDVTEEILKEKRRAAVKVREEVNELAKQLGKFLKKASPREKKEILKKIGLES